MTKLSDNFSLAELTATSQPFANVPSKLQVANLTALCLKVLQPVRDHFGPTTINSGYRSPKVNAAVGSNPSSQHALGEAVDFEVEGISNLVLAQWVRDNLRFDQLILEAYRPGVVGSGWVHVSYRATRFRRSILTMTMGSHGATYSNGLNG